jgi:7,8-dihydro-6-hydroxymethylpterin dimethyltransferase
VSRRVRAHVTAFCPRCHDESPERALATVRGLPAALIEDDGRVLLERECPRHGVVTTLYQEDARILDHLERWTAPTNPPTPDSPRDDRPIPSCYEAGLGARQIQHTCLLLEDVTNACNLRCPTCFSVSAPHAGGFAPTDEVLANVDRRLELEGGRLDVLMLSGGEPTLHPELGALLEGASRRNIVRVLLNTNGLALAHDDDLLELLRTHRERVEVYLQFDGFRERTYRHHRGADLLRTKRRAIARLSAAEVFTTLVVAAELGVNDDELGEVVLLALETPFVGGVCIQPVFGSGRSSGLDPMRRLTHTGVLARLGPQTGGVVTWEDLTALPCSHPHCASVGYLFRTDDGAWRSLVSLIGADTLRRNLDLVSNRMVFPNVAPVFRRLLVAGSLRAMLSERSSLVDPGFQRLFRTVARRRGLGVAEHLRSVAPFLRDPVSARRVFGERVKRITVKPFMDVGTMLEERLRQCCVHVGTVDGVRHQAIPFCAAQAWPELSAMKVGAPRGRLVEA